jgi:hypothetical protein
MYVWTHLVAHLLPALISHSSSSSHAKGSQGSQEGSPWLGIFALKREEIKC